MSTKWIYWLEKQSCQLTGWQTLPDCISHIKSSFPNPLLPSLESNSYLSELKLKRRDKEYISMVQGNERHDTQYEIRVLILIRNKRGYYSK